MNIKDWIVHPLAVLWSTSKPISTVEQRQYLYNQERKLEKLVRNQEWLSGSIGNFISSREDQIQSILSYQSSQNSSQLETIQDLWWWISSWMDAIFNWLKELDKTQIKIFKEELKALWIIDENIRDWFFILEKKIEDWFTDMLDWISNQTVILQNISNQIWNIIDTLKNPRKIEWLEYKKDAVNYLQNKWFEESLEYLYLASEKLTTDQEVFYLIWLIEFEENKDYDKAIENLNKAIKYAKWNKDDSIYIQSLDKIASIIFIQSWWEEIKKAYDYQLEVVNINKSLNQNYIYDLIKYSVIIWEYETFEKYLYILLTKNPSLILEISTNELFTRNNKLIRIIDNVIWKVLENENKKTHRLSEVDEIDNLNSDYIFDSWIISNDWKLGIWVMRDISGDNTLYKILKNDKILWSYDTINEFDFLEKRNMYIWRVVISSNKFWISINGDSPIEYYDKCIRNSINQDLWEVHYIVRDNKWRWWISINWSKPKQFLEFNNLKMLEYFNHQVPKVSSNLKKYAFLCRVNWNIWLSINWEKPKYDFFPIEEPGWQWYMPHLYWSVDKNLFYEVHTKEWKQGVSINWEKPNNFFSSTRSYTLANWWKDIVLTVTSEKWNNWVSINGDLPIYEFEEFIIDIYTSNSNIFVVLCNEPRKFWISINWKRCDFLFDKYEIIDLRNGNIYLKVWINWKIGLSINGKKPEKLYERDELYSSYSDKSIWPELEYYWVANKIIDVLSKDDIKLSNFVISPDKLTIAIEMYFKDRAQYWISINWNFPFNFFESNIKLLPILDNGIIRFSMNDYKWKLTFCEYVIK